jgi:hypothetical protein
LGTVSKKAPKPVLTVHFGDLHVGGTGSLCPPRVALDSGGAYEASKAQRWFWDCWLAFWADVADLKRRHGAEVVAVCGGDEGEGDHHQTTQVWFESGADQERAVRQVLKVGHPVADRWVFVRGTEAHEGPLSSATEARAEGLALAGWPVERGGGTFSHWIYTAVLGGVRFQVKHQPQTRSLVPHTQDASASRQAQYVWEDYAKDWTKPPDVAVWHHVHYRAKGWYQGTFCYVCPSWQLPTAWASRRASSPRVERPGGVCFLCEGGTWKPVELSYRPESSVAWAR